MSRKGTLCLTIIVAGGNGAVGLALTILAAGTNDVVNMIVSGIATAVGFGIMGFLIGDELEYSRYQTARRR